MHVVWALVLFDISVAAIWVFCVALALKLWWSNRHPSKDRD